MKALPNVFLVGPMGAGKSTIGRLLAAELKRDFRDTDREIEERLGVDIPWIFDMEGEAGFRTRETAMLEELTALDNIVLATGGGIVLRPENRKLLAARGTVVYLMTTLEEQAKRTARDRKRPLLQGDNPRQVLETLMAERDPLYREVADYIIDTSGRSPKAVAQELARRIAN